MENLALSLKYELEYDKVIHETGILPKFINLPCITACVFCQFLTSKLSSVLENIPPPQPNPESIDMLIGTGELQQYLIKNNLQYENKNITLDAFKLFGPFVSNWIKSSQVIKLSYTLLFILNNIYIF